MCLLHLLTKVAQKSNLSLHAAHINYGLRGKESDGDEKFVRSFCKDLKIPLSVYSSKVSKKAEEVFRTIRYNYFESLRKELGYTKIAVGHTQNDQAETLLLHLFRGCGVEGMQGMSSKNGVIIRPLLSFSREEILRYLKENEIAFRTDSSNASTEYTRNFVRNRLLPIIQKNIQPNIIKTLSRNAALFADDADFLRSLKRFDYKEKNGEYTLKCKEFLLLPASSQKQVLRGLLTELRGSGKNISFGNIEELRKALASKKNKHQKITFLGLIYKRKGDTVTLRGVRKVSD